MKQQFAMPWNGFKAIQTYRLLYRRIKPITNRVKFVYGEFTFLKTKQTDHILDVYDHAKSIAVVTHTHTHTHTHTRNLSEKNHLCIREQYSTDGCI